MVDPAHILPNVAQQLRLNKAFPPFPGAFMRLLNDCSLASSGHCLSLMGALNRRQPMKASERALIKYTSLLEKGGGGWRRKPSEH